MSSSLLWLAVPLVVGLCQPVIWQMNLRIAGHTGSMESAVILHVVGTVFGLSLAVGGMRGEWAGGLAAIPWWAWLAGVIGISGMAAMNRAIPEIGVGSALALTVAAQMVSALVFEQNGWMGAALREATWDRWLGALLLVLGAWLVSR